MADRLPLPRRMDTAQASRTGPEEQSQLGPVVAGRTACGLTTRPGAGTTQLTQIQGVPSLAASVIPHYEFSSNGLRHTRQVSYPLP